LGLPPNEGDEVRIVGYGCNDLTTKLGSGIKRTGTNKIAHVGDYLELLSTPRSTTSSNAILGPSNQAGSCFGDSGGPMLHVQNDAYRVVGVTHAGGWSSNLLLSEFVNVNRVQNMEFIEDIDAEYELHIFDGCWNSADPEACGPMSASFKIFSFFKWLFVAALSLF
jgi:hypothetical protein